MPKKLKKPNLAKVKLADPATYTQRPSWEEIKVQVHGVSLVKRLAVKLEAILDELQPAYIDRGDFEEGGLTENEACQVLEAALQILHGQNRLEFVPESERRPV